MENTQNQPGRFYDTSLEHTLENMKTASIFFEMEERPKGDMFWNKITVQK